MLLQLVCFSASIVLFCYCPANIFGLSVESCLFFQICNHSVSISCPTLFSQLQNGIQQKCLKANSGVFTKILFFPLQVKDCKRFQRRIYTFMVTFLSSTSSYSQLIIVKPVTASWQLLHWGRAKNTSAACKAVACCRKHYTALKIKSEYQPGISGFLSDVTLSHAPLYLESDRWRMLIWKGCNGFFLSILRQLSTIYVQTVSLTEGALSCPQPIHHCNRQAPQRDRCDDGAHGWLGQQVCVHECVCADRDREIVFYLSSCRLGQDMIDGLNDWVYY